MSFNLDNATIYRLWYENVLDIDSLILFNLKELKRINALDFSAVSAINYFVSKYKFKRGVVVNWTPTLFFINLTRLYREGLCTLSTPSIEVEAKSQEPKESEFAIKNKRSLIGESSYLYLAIANSQLGYGTTINQNFLNKWEIDWSFIYQNLPRLLYTDRFDRFGFTNGLLVDLTDRMSVINNTALTEASVRSLKPILSAATYFYLIKKLDNNPTINYLDLQTNWELSVSSVNTALNRLTKSKFVTTDFQTAQITWLKTVNATEIQKILDFLSLPGKLLYLAQNQNQIDITEFSTINNIGEGELVKALDTLKSNLFINYQIGSTIQWL